MKTLLSSLFAPRLLASLGIVALLGGIGLFASRPAHTAGGPVPVTVTNTPLATVAVDAAAPSLPIGVQQVIPVMGGFGGDTVYIVPAGKRLVIETISASTEFPTDVPDSYSVLVVVNKFATFAGISLQPEGSLAVGSQAVHLYANPGTTVQARIFGKSTANDAKVGVGISGYLVDAPAGAAQSQSASPEPAPKGMATTQD